MRHHLTATRLAVFALAVLGAGCASTPAPEPDRGAPAAASPEAAPEPAVEVPAAAPPAVETPAAEAPEAALEDTAEAEEGVAEEELYDGNGVEGTLATGEALGRAIEWTAEGLALYEKGDFAAAGSLLNDAHIILLEADLPEVVQEAGPAALLGVLPEGLRHLDVAAIVKELAASDGGELPERAYIEREARRILRRFGADAPDDAYLEHFVGEVEQYIRYYQGSGREFYERSYQRKHKYWPTIQAIFAARGIPEELGYMALVESGFNPRARSHAGARGLWQFIPSTGRMYQLRRVEDFYDVVKATEAASEYLLDLIGLFGSRSFLLATAAYNAGEGRIGRCLRRLEDPFTKRSFWEIRDCLARETREYVPRILAAAVIGSDPARFGFDLPSAEEMGHAFDVVTIPAPTSLSTIASRAGVSVAALRTANTDLATSARATPARNFPLYVPRGGGERLVESLAAKPRIEVDRAPSAPPAATPPTSDPLTRSDALAGAPFEYEVRRGDSLGEIAGGFGVSVSDLKAWNPFLNQRVLYRGDRLKIYPSSGSVERVTYRVRRGDTLSTIARRHGVSYRDLARWNDLSAPYRLQIGQRLAVYPQGSTPEHFVYTVKRGNTLGAIAEIFSVRYRDVMSWNQLGSSTVRVGQQLVIHPSRGLRIETYRVQRGDTVAKIARRFGVPVRHVLTANGLSTRTLIRPGQRLTVYVPG